MSAEQSTRRTLRAALLLSFVFIAGLVPTFKGYGYDVWCWREWTKHIQAHGLLQAYGSGTDYPPVAQYILWFFGKVTGTAENVEMHYHQFRLFTYAFDLLGVYVVWRWTGKQGAFAALALLSLLNLASSYNTIIWGQVDGVLATLVMTAVYLAWKEKGVVSAIMMTVALLFKLQAVVFLPLWGLLVLGCMAKGGRWRKAPSILLAALATATIVLLPFMLTEASRAQLAQAVFGSVDRYPNISRSAHNWWHLIHYQRTKDPDSDIWKGGVTYKAAGLVAFCVASAIALWPMLMHTLRQFGKEKALAFPRERLWLTAALIAINFFYWPTQMHERYSHPAMIFLFAYAITSWDWIAYAVFCLAYVLNLEAIMMALRLKNYDTALFDPRFHATLYGLLIIYLIARLYGWQALLHRKEETKTRGGPDFQLASAKVG